MKPTDTAQPLVFGRGAGVRVDLERLILSRMLVEANSGAGKSHLVRALCEGTHGRVQHLILDPEGEFASLREKFDYVLAAKSNGDVEASVRTAAMLCRRLMELRVSAIIDLYDLGRDERTEFVRRFLAELLGLPRELWHAVLVILDEAHKFAPETGESVSTESVVDLASQGRKRGFALVAATQRISKLKKDVAAELLNVFVGRTGLDVDVKRAGDDLGFDKTQRFTLKTMRPGDFFAYGPAISNEVILVRGPEVITTHPKAGKITAAPPPAPEKIKAVLSKLGDIPKEAETRAQTIEQYQKDNRELRRRITDLERQVAAKPEPKPLPAPKPEKVSVLESHDSERLSKAVEHLRQMTVDLVEATNSVSESRAKVQTISEQILGRLEQVKSGGAGATAPQPAQRPAPAMSSGRVGSVGGSIPSHPTNGNGHSGTAKVPRTVLIAVAQHQGGVTRSQLSVLTGYKRSSRDAYVSRLKAQGFVDLVGDKVVVTPDGVAHLGSEYQTLPTGRDLLDYWLKRLPVGERKILEVVSQRWPDATPRDELDQLIGFKRSSRDAYLARLRARQLIVEAGRGAVSVSQHLVEA